MLLFSGGGTYGMSKPEIVDLYNRAEKEIGGYGALKQTFNTAIHDHFFVSSETHVLVHRLRVSNLAYRVDHTNLTQGYTYVVYRYIDTDYDGKVDICDRRVYFAYDDEGHMITPVWPDESLKDVINDWSNNVPQCQERYDEELKFWKEYFNKSKEN